MDPSWGLSSPHTSSHPLDCRKKVPCKFSVIHDLSAPFEGISLNSCIPTRDGIVTYDIMDMAIQLIQRAGQGAILAKTDIKHAYKLIPIHPDDIPALGILWFSALVV